MVLPLNREYLWIQKVLLILLHNTNPIFIIRIIEAFSHFVVTVPIKSNNAQTPVRTLSHHWITNFGPPIYLGADRESEDINNDMALMGIKQLLEQRIHRTAKLSCRSTEPKSWHSSPFVPPRDY